MSFQRQHRILMPVRLWMLFLYVRQFIIIHWKKIFISHQSKESVHPLNVHNFTAPSIEKIIPFSCTFTKRSSKDSLPVHQTICQ